MSGSPVDEGGPMPGSPVDEGGRKEITTLLFDLDNTLLLTTEADSTSCHQVSVWLIKQGVAPEQSKLITQTFLQKYREAPAPPYATDQVGLDLWRKNIWAAVLPPDSLHLLDKVFTLWKRERLSQLSFEPSVREMLETLGDNFNLGIITNGPSVAQWEKIRETGCEKYFTSIIVSGDLDVEKPNRDIYDLAFDELQVDASECVMVGDKLETDIQGGINAGVGATVRIKNRTSRRPPPDIEPDYTIPCVTDLKYILPLISAPPSP